MLNCLSGVIFLRSQLRRKTGRNRRGLGPFWTIWAVPAWMAVTLGSYLRIGEGKDIDINENLP